MEDKIQLGLFKNINSINQDLNIPLPLSSSKNLLIEYDINNVLDISQVFDEERQDTDVYRLYGKIEYLSPLNKIIKNYNAIEDFFTILSPSTTAETKTIITDFKFYLVASTTAYTALITGNTGGTFIKNYQVISNLNNFEIYNAGFSTNVFGEQEYAWNFNTDFNLENRYDGLNFPLTELYLYCEYQSQENNSGNYETMEYKTYDSFGNTVIAKFNSIPLVSGNTLTGDIIIWDKYQFTQQTINQQEFYIYTPYSSNTLTLKWKYYPFIPITIRVFDDSIQTANISGTSYENIIKVPTYATKIDNDGNYVWRNLLDRGFLDPLTAAGVNYPFVNQKQYVFNNIILIIKPDFTDDNTASVFNQISYAEDTFISSQPNSNLTDIGKPCK